MSVYCVSHGVRAGQFPAGGETGKSVRHEAKAARQQVGIWQSFHGSHAHGGLDQVSRMGGASD